MNRFSTFLAVLLALTLVSSVATGAARDIRSKAKNTQEILGATAETLAEAVALGKIPGAYVVNKFGYNGALTAAGTEESIWDADDLPTTADGPVRCNANTATAKAAFISSDDEADAAVTVQIEWLDASYVLHNDLVTLGADNQATGTEYVAIGTVLRINRAYAVSAALAGNVYIHIDAVDAATKDGEPDSPATQTLAVITAGENQTLQACYTVPAGFNALLVSTCVSNLGIGTPAVTFRERISVDGGPPRTQEKLSMADELTVCKVVDPPMFYAAKTDIEMTGDATTQSAGATFGLILIPEGLK
jgi:hypothetical protein